MSMVSNTDVGIYFLGGMYAELSNLLFSCFCGLSAGSEMVCGVCSSSSKTSA